MNAPVTTRLSLTDALHAARETRSLELGNGILESTPAVFRRHFGDKEAILIVDENTLSVAGRKVQEAFKRAKHPCRAPFVFTDPGLYAEHKFVEVLEAGLKQHNAIPVAVGSGTINDLTKLASHRTGRPYMVVGTAASMDGYTAFGASITYQGSKQTFSCPAPTAVLADLDIVRSAPNSMAASGYADMIAKVTAGADWILADALGAEPIHQMAWNIAQGGLRPAIADPAGVRRGDPTAVRELTEGLMLGGFAMQSAQSSRPASGAEHQFSHLWDMQHHVHNGVAPSHGFKVGIGTLAMTAMYEYMLEQALEKLDVERACAAWPDSATLEKTVAGLFKEGDLLVVAQKESQAKWTDVAGLRKQLTTLRENWAGLLPVLRNQLLPFGEIQQRLRAVGAPAEPEEIGISRERLRQSFIEAGYIRRRFTLLDVANRTQTLQPAIEHIFGPRGPWPI